jgi:hypothetical protein
MRWIMVLLLAGCPEELPNSCDFRPYDITGAIDPDEQDPRVLEAIAECHQEGRCHDVCGSLIERYRPGGYNIVVCEPLDPAPSTRFHVVARDRCID